MRTDLWTKDQLILALNFYWKIPYNKISGSANQEIKALATIIGKSPAALAFMLMNFTALDEERQEEGKKGKRPPGQLAQQLWFEYLNQWGKLVDDSVPILERLGQNAVVEFFKTDIVYKYTEGLEKERLVKVRVNQSDFRQRILASYNNKCCITNIDIPTLLVASHIIPWSKNVTERLNPRNGLCLNSIHDRAFDKGLMTVTTDFKVKLSKGILKKRNDKEIQNLFIRYENQQIILPDRYLPDPKFLEWHHEHCFEKYRF